MLLQNFLGFPQLAQVRESLRGTDPFDGVLRWLNVTVAADGIAHLPATGPCVVVANHPHGILDGAVLMHALRERCDAVKVLANRELCAADELRPALIPVDVDGRSPNTRPVREALAHLAAGGVLVLFPAGSVAQAGDDDPWQATAGRLVALAAARIPGLRIVPAAIEGRNSLLFQLTGAISRTLRRALLLRELWNKRGALIEVRFGKPVSAERISQERDAAAYLRWRVDLLRKAPKFRARSGRPLSLGIRHRRPVAPAGDPGMIALEIAGLTPVAVSGEMAAYIAAANQIPRTLREIGRLREISFRAAGEGTGKPADLDEFDASYLHLFVWNSASREIAGAYRMKPVLPGETAPSDLYTSTLFRYDERFVRGLGHALELGRSFVCPAYQRGFTTLLLLWRGIGHWVSANPRHATLFGPVSISDSYSPCARRAVFSYLRGKAWKESGVRGWAQPDWPLDPVISRDASELDDAIGGMPVLLRHYLNLGGKLLGFNVDRKFSNVLDGLIVVDLRQTARKLLDRYLTRQGAEKVLQA